MFVPLAHFVSGTWAPVQLLPPTVAIVGYAVRARTLAAQGRPVPLGKQLCFAGGMFLIYAALVSPVAHLGGELVLAHMVQHLLMADLGALLIVLGLTGPLLQPLLALPYIGRLRVLANPAVALPLWIVDLYVWHIPALYQATLDSDAVHALQHTSFVFFGITMWMALFGPLPQPEWFGNGAKLLYIVGVRLAGALLGNVFIWSGTVFYPDYGRGDAYWDISRLNDQGIAGTIMMIEGSLVTIVLFGWLFMKAARESEEKQDLLEFAESRGIDLSETRAARAVGAGRGAELRQRLEQSG
jgi:cytochrome c oxidase assembly factor CtaG